MTNRLGVLAADADLNGCRLSLSSNRDAGQEGRPFRSAAGVVFGVSGVGVHLEWRAVLVSKPMSLAILIFINPFSLLLKTDFLKPNL